MKAKAILPLLVLFFATIQSRGQDIHFSQVANTPLFQNPANSGAFQGDHRATLNYRNQWATVATPYTTYGMAYDMGLLKKPRSTGFMGLGIVAYSDKAGDANLTTSFAGLSLAWHQSLGNMHTLSGGAQASVVQNSISPAAMQWDNQYDGTGFNPALSSGETRSFEPFFQVSVGAGMLYSFKTNDAHITSNDGASGSFGVGVYHINTPEHSFYELTGEDQFSRIVGHGVLSIGLPRTHLALQPSFLYQLQGASSELVAGSMLRYRIQEASHFTSLVEEFAISMGVHYRLKDAIIGSMLLEYGHFAFGISYDINTSELQSASQSRGGMELMLRFVSPNPFKSKNHVTMF